MVTRPVAKLPVLLVAAMARHTSEVSYSSHKTAVQRVVFFCFSSLITTIPSPPIFPNGASVSQDRSEFSSQAGNGRRSVGSDGIVVTYFSNHRAESFGVRSSVS